MASAGAEAQSTEKNESSFKNLYKYSNRDTARAHDERRQKFLAAQKEKRGAAFDEKRDITDLFPEPMESDGDSKPHKRRKKKVPFNYKFMQSEWFIYPPEDLAENWLVKLCPEGVRLLVVAHKGITICYTRKGSICRFRSNFPGSDRDCCGNRFTVLDCVYSRPTKTFFIFDVLAWNSMSLLDAETSMRFYWLKTKFEEEPDLRSSKCKRYNFILVDTMPAQLSLIQDAMSSPLIIGEFALPYEGILFYHKDCHYVFGYSPLVGWLKSFMLPEIFNIDVDSYHIQKIPDGYENVAQYVESVSNKKKRHGRYKAHNSAMEAEDLEVEEVEQGEDEDFHTEDMDQLEHVDSEDLET